MRVLERSRASPIHMESLAHSWLRMVCYPMELLQDAPQKMVDSEVLCPAGTANLSRAP